MAFYGKPGGPGGGIPGAARNTMAKHPPNPQNNARATGVAQPGDLTRGAGPGVTYSDIAYPIDRVGPGWDMQPAMPGMGIRGGMGDVLRPGGAGAVGGGYQAPVAGRGDAGMTPMAPVAPDMGGGIPAAALRPANPDLVAPPGGIPAAPGGGIMNRGRKGGGPPVLRPGVMAY